MSLPNRDLVSPNDDAIYSEYLGRRSYWESIGAENIKLLDEQLVFLSSGALVFSISVVDLLGPYYNFHWLCVIWTPVKPPLNWTKKSRELERILAK